MRRSSALLALALVALLVPAAARADGDPASDVLVGQNVFYPFDVTFPKASQARLDEIVASAKAAGYPVRVALIPTRYDLGAIPSLFGRPLQYAPFLGKELSFVFKGPLLVVMPQGYGFYWTGHDTGPERAALARLGKPASRDLAAEAVTAVHAVAAARGHDLPIPAGSSGGSNNTRDRLVIGGAAVVALLAAAAVVLLRRRRAASRAEG